MFNIPSFMIIDALLLSIIIDIFEGEGKYIQKDCHDPDFD